MLMLLLFLFLEGKEICWSGQLFPLNGWHCSVTLQVLFIYSVYFFWGPGQQSYFKKTDLNMWKSLKEEGKYNQYKIVVKSDPLHYNVVILNRVEFH